MQENESNYLNCTKNSKVILEREEIGYRFHPENRLITGLIELQDFETTNTKDSFIKNEDWFLLEDVMENLLIKAIKRVSISAYINKVRESLDKISEVQNINIRNQDFIDVNYDFTIALEDIIEDLSDNLKKVIDDLKIKVDEKVWLEFKSKYIREKICRK